MVACNVMDAGSGAADEPKRLRDGAYDLGPGSPASSSRVHARNCSTEITATCRGSQHVLRMIPAARVHRRFVEQHLAECEDGTKHIVEVVRDPARKAADRLHFRRQSQPLFKFRLLAFRALALGHLPVQLLVGGREFHCALGQVPALVQPDRSLVRRHVEQEPLRLQWEIRASGSRDQHSHVALESQAHRDDRNVPVPDRIPHPQQRCVSKFSQPDVEQPTELRRAERTASLLTHANRLDRGAFDWILEARIREIQVQPSDQDVEQRADDLRRLAAAPDGAKSEDAHQVADAALEAPDLVSGGFHRRVHVVVAS